MGWWSVIAVLILARNAVRLEKRIDDSDTVDHLAMLHVFREHLLATGTPGGMDHQCIPIREFVEAMQIDRG